MVHRDLNMQFMMSRPEVRQACIRMNAIKNRLFHLNSPQCLRKAPAKKIIAAGHIVIMTKKIKIPRINRIMYLP